jgi:hypothetical protein
LGELSASELITKLKDMDSDTEDALTRFYLRLLKAETWSYQLRKENLLPKPQSQEAYRKKLNKFVKLGFLSKGKRYYVDGKPRNPFKANNSVIQSLIRRYSIAKYEEDTALIRYREIEKTQIWQSLLDDKLSSSERLRFLDTLFPILFIGEEIIRFFLKLLFISTFSKNVKKTKNQSSTALMELLTDLDVDSSIKGIDYIGKRMFLDIYVKDVMALLYASGHQEKHWEIMKMGILEEFTITLLSPQDHPGTNAKVFKRFSKLSCSKRFDEMIEYIKSVKDHFVKDYYGRDWENELSSYVAYAITSSIERPNPQIREFLTYLEKKYSITSEVIDSVEFEIQKKIDRHDAKSDSLIP